MNTVTTAQMELEAPLKVPLPEGPSREEYFTPAQWTTLLAILDTVIPEVHRETTTTYQLAQLTLSKPELNAAVADLGAKVIDAPSIDELEEYLAERPSDSPLFQDLLERTLIQYTRPKDRDGLGAVLSALK